MEKNKLILKAEDLNRVLDIISNFYGQSSFMNNAYKNYVRLFSEGNGLLHLVVNNHDLKIIQYIDIEHDISINKIYLIPELTNIIPKLKSYDYFIIENDQVIFEDGRISLISIQLENEEIEGNYSINVPFDSDTEFVVDEHLNKEIDKIFKVIDLKKKTEKNKNSRNSYFSDEDTLYFDFADVRILKPSFFNYINSDIFSLKIVALMFKYSENQNIQMKKTDNKFYLNANLFFIQGHQLKIDNVDKQMMKKLFNDEKKTLMNIKSKLELLYFVDVVAGYDSSSNLIFSKGKVKVDSVNKEFIAEFNIEDMDVDKEFIISTEVFAKILKFAVSYSKISQLEWNIIERMGSKFLELESGDAVVLSEVL
jgi:hypothetical protein